MTSIFAGGMSSGGGTNTSFFGASSGNGGISKSFFAASSGSGGGTFMSGAGIAGSLVFFGKSTINTFVGSGSGFGPITGGKLAASIELAFGFTTGGMGGG